MNLFLHNPESKSELAKYYKRAFIQAVELFVVTAYLTEWDETLELNPLCRSFRLIIGKDFGITRKAACEKVLRWLPPQRKSQFLVADMIAGFHPKAVFWKENNGDYFAIIGSSNLTRAAFETNFEANVFSQISEKEYEAAKIWVKHIEKLSISLSEDWLSQYKEGTSTCASRDKKSPKKNTVIETITLKLPKHANMKQQVEIRRTQLAAYEKNRKKLIRLFRKCALGEISSPEFYERLPNYWSGELGNRLQGAGWERQGKNSDFRELAKSYLRILEASDNDRDDVVREEIDELHVMQVTTRKAFLSEMLCLEFPAKYPILNNPIQDYLAKMKFKAPQRASEGSRYIDLAIKLRSAIIQNPNHPAKNLAELDTVIWLVSPKKK